MNWRTITGLCMTLGAALVPLAVVVVVFGPDARIAEGGREAVDQAIALIGGTVAGAIISVSGLSLMRAGDRAHLVQLVRNLLRTGRGRRQRHA